jgi:RimJ/RimL family protein N-acetyltransferase
MSGYLHRMPGSPRAQAGSIELRLTTPRSAQQLFALARDPHVSTMLQWPAHKTVDDSLQFIHDARALWEREAAWLPGIFHTDRDDFIGCIGLSSIDRANLRAEVGTWLGIPHQGHGYNLYAKAAVVRVAFEVLGLRRLELLVRVDNERSLSAARRLPAIRDEGIQFDRIKRDETSYDARCFSLLARDYDPTAWPSVIIHS